MPVVGVGALADGGGSVVDALWELERLRAAVLAHRAATLGGAAPVGGVRRQDRLLWALVPEVEPVGAEDDEVEVDGEV